MVIAVLAVMIPGGFMILSTGQSTWFTTDTRVELQENLRQTVDKLTRELSQTGFGAGILML